MSPDDMAKRVLLISERAMTTTVNSIEHIEATSYNGVGLIRVYLQPGANIDLAMSQIVAVNQTILRTLPPGIFPPLVVQYDASSVPILQLGLSSDTLTEQELYDYGQNFIRTRLSTVPGISVPLPYGGKVRSVMVDLNPAALCWQRALSNGRLERAQSAKSDSPHRHRESGDARIPDPAQQQSGTGIGPERCADQDCKRRARLYARCCPGERWIPGPDEYRPGGRTSDQPC